MPKLTLDNKKLDKLKKILTIVYEINQTGNYALFWYWGQLGHLDITVHKDNWKKNGVELYSEQLKLEGCEYVLKEQTERLRKLLDKLKG